MMIADESTLNTALGQQKLDFSSKVRTTPSCSEVGPTSAFPLECMGQLAYFEANLTPLPLKFPLLGEWVDMELALCDPMFVQSRARAVAIGLGRIVALYYRSFHYMYIPHSLI
jgi:hypothetical protein